ncbi:hypothetical protein X975_25080, partial [Stegodyphus mimosarum]
MLAGTWREIEYRLNILRATKGSTRGSSLTMVVKCFESI